MARIVLHTIYPFSAGTTRQISDDHFLTIEMETAKTKALWWKFEIVEHLPTREPYGLERFSLITDACEALPKHVAAMTRDCSPRETVSA